MFNNNRQAHEQEVNKRKDKLQLAKKVESKIEESLYHLVCLEVMAKELFKIELDVRQISGMKYNMLQLLKASRRI